MRRAVFFDRDGVLNKAVVKNNKPFPPFDISELKIEENAFEALKKISSFGLMNFVVTNQPDVSRKTNTRFNVEQINNVLLNNLEIQEIATCFHDNNDNCNCRKPKAGSLLKLASKYGIDLEKSWLVGDRKTDIDAGKNAKCKTIFIDRGYDEIKPQNSDETVFSFEQAVERILRDLENEN